MKLSNRSIWLGLIASSLPLAVACGSNDTSGLFTNAGGDSSIGAGGSSSVGGSVSSQAGQSSAGTSSSSSGAGGTSSVAGQGTGGSSAAGDASVAGTSANAGTSAGGATGGMSMGGSATAGDTSMGGTSAGTAGDTSMGGTTAAGSSGSGGSGGLVDPCPQDAPPQNGVLCVEPTPDNCFYPGTACSCVVQVNSVARHFSCYGSGADKCPAGTEQDPVPMDGAACKGLSGSACPYSAHDFCVCVPPNSGGGDPHWQCSTDSNPVCPQTRPDKGTPCTDVKECAFADRECFCNGVNWVCE